MTSLLPPTVGSAADVLDRERQAILDDLSLAMLFIDAGHVRAEAAEAPTATGIQSLRLEVIPHETLGAVAAASLLCRVLHDARVPGVEIARTADGIRIRFPYPPHVDRWTVEIAIDLRDAPAG